MRGKHISVAQIKSAAIRHKILCIVMAIALLTLMIPGGLRAHAENDATETQSSEEQVVVQDQADSQQVAEDQQIVPATQDGEEAQAETVVGDDETVEITFVADPPGSATFEFDGDVPVSGNTITVNKGAFSYHSSSKNPQLSIYKANGDWEHLLCEVTCTPGEGNTFKNWDDYCGAETFDENGTITAYIETPQPPVPDICTINLSVEGEGTATFDNYD